MRGQEFDAVLGGHDGGPGCAVALPFDPKLVFGKARAPVRVSIDGHPSFRTTIAVYGGVGFIGLRKAQQAELGVGVGDTVHVIVGIDDEPREVEVPPELTAALVEADDAAAVYERLSFTHRREYARWVAEAKRQQTRQARAVKAVAMLRAGARTPG